MANVIAQEYSQDHHWILHVLHTQEILGHHTVVRSYLHPMNMSGTLDVMSAQSRFYILVEMIEGTDARLSVGMVLSEQDRRTENEHLSVTEGRRFLPPAKEKIVIVPLELLPLALRLRKNHQDLHQRHRPGLRRLNQTPCQSIQHELL